MVLELMIELFLWAMTLLAMLTVVILVLSAILVIWRLWTPLHGALVAVARRLTTRSR
jgi:uncharacterized membrane protein YqjE